MKSKVEMVLITEKKEGLVSKKNCFLIFTRDNLILSFLEKKRLKDEISSFRKKIKNSGQGFVKGTLSMINFWNSYGNRYYEIPPQAILKEDSRNFEILHSEVIKISFIPMKRNQKDSSEMKGKIVVYANGKKMKFLHKYTDKNKQIMDVLMNIYLDRLKYSGKSRLSVDTGKRKRINERNYI